MDGFDYDAAKELTFCEPCIEGKQHNFLLMEEEEKKGLWILFTVIYVER